MYFPNKWKKGMGPISFGFFGATDDWCFFLAFSTIAFFLGSPMGSVFMKGGTPRLQNIGTEFLEPPPRPSLSRNFLVKCCIFSWLQVPTALSEGGANAGEMSRNRSVDCLHDTKTNHSK